MLTGLLRPKPSDTNPWLFPIMMASRGALHSTDRRRWLYPKRTIWLDLSRGPDDPTPHDGDGTHGSPLRKMATLLADDTLACVCNHLCADHMTVRVKGPATLNEGTRSSPEPTITVVDGQGRHYNRRLLLRPWADGTRLKVTATLRHTMDAPSGAATVTFNQVIHLVKNLHGVRWKDTDFDILLLVASPPAKDTGSVQVSASGDLAALHTCNDTILQNCTITITCRIDALHIQDGIIDTPEPPQATDPDNPNGGVSDGSGGDGSGSSPGDTGNEGGDSTYPWPPSGDPPPPDLRYPWPPAPDEPEPPDATLPSVTPNATATASGLRSCLRPIIRGTAIAITARANSNVGASSSASGLRDCHIPDISGLSSAQTAASLVTGYGKTTQTGGIAPYAMLALADAAGLRACRGGTTAASSFHSVAHAIAIAGNTPTEGGIGGYSRATAHGIATAGPATLSGLVISTDAQAAHPTSASSDDSHLHDAARATIAP